MTMRQRLAHIALGGVLVLSGMIASSFLQTADSQQSHTEIVKAREFHVVDENGATTAVIASRPNGLVIQNTFGKTKLAFFTGPNGIDSLGFINSKNEIAAAISGHLDGSGAMFICNSKSKPAVSLSTGPDGSGAVLIHRQNGFSSHGVSIMVDEHGGRVSVFGKGSDKSKATMGVNEYGTGAISTWDKNGYRQR